MFLYESVMGLRKHEGQGCILADEMFGLALSFRRWSDLILDRGLGKTLQVSFKSS